MASREAFKGWTDLDDILTAAVIRNLKAVHDRYQVMVMDADGSRSKGIARYLRTLGVKRPYLVQRGFQSWVKQGIQAKELKPETVLTILNELELCFKVGEDLTIYCHHWPQSGVCSLLLDLESRHFHGQQENWKTTALVYLHDLHLQMFKTGCCKLLQRMNPNHLKLKFRIHHLNQ
ncbi:uncharacterized protein LOC133667909 [Populus nigra]|uniref:uncharacterized protein LOC133667909 n=1 Tax=Populus nigra TaxID=3691 RepID=UPI002B26D104|nr:uncharacterized protein LOC133667909 [Populus nigra]